jgi:hypothetical protein
MRVSKTLVAAAIVSAVATTAPSVAGAQTYSQSSSYANPDNTTTEVIRRRGPCTDPWVTMALERVYGSADRILCDARRYNNGSWSSFNQLVHAVGKVSRLPVFDVRTGTARNVSDVSVDVFEARGRKVGTITNGEFVVDPAMVSTMVAAGGGNLIGNDGSTLVGNDGASLIGNDSGGLKPKLEMKLEAASLSASGGGKYGLLGVMKFSAIKAATRKR